MSDTPRTDDWAEIRCLPHDHSDQHQTVPADLARELERELVAATELLRQALPEIAGVEAEYGEHGEGKLSDEIRAFLDGHVPARTPAPDDSVRIRVPDSYLGRVIEGKEAVESTAVTVAQEKSRAALIVEQVFGIRRFPK